MKMIKFFVTVIFCATLTAGSKDEVTIDIKATSSETLLYGHNFTFSCNASSNVTLTAIIDGHATGHKFDRLKNATVAKKNETHFTFQNTMPLDNGTSFRCKAEVNGHSYTSKSVVLQVLYPPIFSNEANNVTILKQIPTTKDAVLHCDVIANPTNVSFHFTNTASDSSGVTTKVVHHSNATITFKKAKVYNRGEYTCTASNSIGTTNLTYNTFIGGAPDKVSINCSSEVKGGLQVYSCCVNDTSDAPATSLSFTILGLVNVTNKSLSFNESDIPVINTTFSEAISVDLLTAYPGNYTLIVTAINQLGHTVVVNETTFIHGLDIKVTLTSANNFTVVEGNAFNFTCGSTLGNATYDVFINGNDSGESHQRLIQTTKTKNSQSYSFTNTNFKDNTHTIQCVVKNLGHSYKSPEVPLDVQFAPKYTLGGVTGTPVNNSKKAVIAIDGYIANPDIVNVTWTLNGTVLKNNTLPDQLILHNVLVTDEGNYTVHTCNVVGCGNGTVAVDVYYAPQYAALTLATPLNGSAVTLNISSYQANPKADNVTWTYNGTVLKNNTLPDQLILHNVLVKDKGNYTVHTCNVVGCGNGTVAVDVYWAPQVSLHKLKPAVAGKYYDITINITAHPKPTGSEWIRNGDLILDNGSRVTPSLASLKFDDLKQMDNGTYQYSVKNAIGFANISFVLLVEFAPNITDPGTVGGLINTSSKVDISYVAYPASNTSVKWYFNDTMITDNDNVKVKDTLLSFSKLKKQNNGTYTVSVTNPINTTNASFVFWVYYGPEFSLNTNGSQWIEIRTNDSYNITCTVVDSNPPVTHVNFTYKGSSDNIRIIHNNDTTTTLEITKASHNNTMNYTCEASTYFGKSHSVFQTFVGGLPDKVKIGKIVVKRKGSGKDATVTVSLEVTDDSLAPARNITYNVKGSTTNHTISLSTPIRSKAVSFDILSDTKVSSYGADRVTILFYAANDLGSAYVGMKNVTLTGSSSSAKKSHTVAIVVGVVVPVVVILLIIAAIAGGWYYYKTKKSGYSLLPGHSVQEKDGPDAGHSSYGATS